MGGGVFRRRSWSMGAPLAILVWRSPVVCAASLQEDLSSIAPRSLRNCSEQLVSNHETCSFWPKGLFPLVWRAGGRRRRVAVEGSPRRRKAALLETTGREGEAGVLGTVRRPSARASPGLYNQLSLQHFPASGFTSTDGTLNSDFFINI